MDPIVDFSLVAQQKMLKKLKQKLYKVKIYITYTYMTYIERELDLGFHRNRILFVGIFPISRPADSHIPTPHTWGYKSLPRRKRPPRKSKPTKLCPLVVRNPESMNHPTILCLVLDSQDVFDIKFWVYHIVVQIEKG